MNTQPRLYGCGCIGSDYYGVNIRNCAEHRGVQDTHARTRGKKGKGSTR